MKAKRIKIYSSFEEQENEERKYYLSLTPEQRLQILRKFINAAYGMHGFNPQNLPTKRNFRIVA